MKCLLILLLSLPILLNAQHTEDETNEILEVFHLTGLINDRGLATLTSMVSTQGFLTRIIPTKGRFERNTSGGLYYSAQLINLLKEVYSQETMYRSGINIWLQLYEEAEITDSRLIPEEQHNAMEASWRKQMENHPGHLIEVALGENILDSLQRKSKRQSSFSLGGGRMDWEYYQSSVPVTTSVYDKTAPEVLDLLHSLELITEEIYHHWKTDMEANGYFSSVYLLDALAREMGELETRELRKQQHEALLAELEKAGMITPETAQMLLANDSLLTSSEYNVFLPYLENTVRIDFPNDGLLENGYPALFAALAQIDPALNDFSATIERITTPPGRDSTGEYFEVTVSGLGHSAQTIIHATKSSGDIVGQPPRFSFISSYLLIIDDLLEKAGYEKRLYTAPLYQQLKEANIFPVYISLVDLANQALVDSGYMKLGLRGNKRW